MIWVSGSFLGDFFECFGHGFARCSLSRGSLLSGLRGTDDPRLQRAHKHDVAAAVTRHRKDGLDGYLLLPRIAHKLAEFEDGVLCLPTARAAHGAGLSEKSLEMGLKTFAAFGIQLHKD